MRASQLPTARLPDEESPTGSAATDPAPRRPKRARRDSALVLGRYRLHRRIGTGGFGTVWMAHDEHLERDVAVKILPRKRIAGGRFEREARAAARLSHPAIVTLYEAALDDEGAYLVSELVRGATLEELLDAGRLSDRDVLQIAIALCDGLDHAHAQGVVHRDVKPSNVLVPETPPPHGPAAKLTDFGVARLIGGDSLTRTGDVVGTAEYMAPEQAEGLEAGAPADLYAVALVTYEGLTGVNPVKTGTAAQRARRLGAYLPPLRRQRRELPRELGRAIDLALRPRARERGTIAELRAALVDALPQLDDTPGVVTSPGTPQPQSDDARDPTPQSDDARDATPPPTRIERLLAALAAAVATGWLSAHVLANAPLAPAAMALIAAVLIAAVPRFGWLTLSGALVIASTLQHRPGGALILLAATIVPIILLPRHGGDWPLAVGAPALGLVGLAGAWPAVAARANGAWRRAALGATGAAWLALVAPLAGHALYFAAPATLQGSAGWMPSLSVTVDVVLRPLASSGVLAAAPVWALAALTLPWLVRGRSLAVDLVSVTIWAAMTVSATEAAISVVHAGHGAITPATAAVGAIVSGLVALGDSAADALRAGRARARLP